MARSDHAAQLQSRNARRRLIVKRLGKYEVLEKRQVMANDFLAGTAFIDANSNGQFDADESYLPGAKIELRSADGNTLIQSRNTDSNGAYLFTGLTPGDYKIVNRSATNYASSVALPLSKISTISGFNANSIDVTLRSPTDLQASVDLSQLESNGRVAEDVTVSINGATITTKIGQLPAQLQGNTLVPSSTTEFLTWSTDLYNGLGPGAPTPYSVNATANPVGSGSPHNGHRIAFLYNHFGINAQTDAPALQLAVWELLYDTDTSDLYSGLVSGNFQVLNAKPDTLATAKNYLDMSLNRSESAIFLNAPSPATPTITGTQSIIVAGSFNFGNVPAAKIGDYVWHDKNVSGRQELNEPPIPGATVNLYQGSTLIDTTTTNATGNYQFDHLLAGTYRVEFVTPAGFSQASPANVAGNSFDNIDSDGPVTSSITLTAGQINNSIDQGFYKLATLGDFVWNDKNGNGFQAANEEGIPNARVNLIRNGVTIDSKVTDNTGFYMFTNIVPGVYDVEFVKPDGWAYTSPQGQESSAFDSDGPTAFDVNLESGEVEDKIDQGFYGSGRIGDFVWHDQNANGIQESGEPGIEGATVELMRDTTVVATALTNSNGFYTFEVAPGTYTLRFTKPSAYSSVSPTDATIDTLDSDGLTTAPFRVVSNDINNTFDIGFYNLVKIGNFVWNDLDADGIQDGNEAGIDGVTVTLIQNGLPVATTVTEGGGLYSFGVAPGTYSVRFTKPPGFTKGSSNGDPDSEFLFTAPVTVRSGENNTSLDQGFYNLAKIGSFVWHDLDADGIQDSNEPGIDGVTVSLMQGSTVVTSAITGNGGQYTLNAAPGTYTVKFTKPTTYTEVSPSNQTSSDLDSDGLTSAPITVLSGAVNNTIDQGFYNLAKIGSFVWHDLDADGIQDSNEPGIDGVTVSLMQGLTQVTSAITVNGGQYTLNAAPGTYTVKFTKPSSYTEVSPSNQTSDDLDSDGLTTAAVTVGSGETNNTFDQGFYNLAKIGSFVWHDLDADGIQDSNEPGIDGVTVSLMQGLTQVTSAITVNGGQYTLNAAPGTYTVKFTKPLSYTEVSPSNQTSDDLDSDGLTTAAVTVSSGETNNTFDQGFYNLAKIGSFVWHDLDADGIQDSNEPGIDGVTVSLMQGLTQVTSAITVNGGQYTLNAAPGTYTVKFTKPSTYTEVSPSNQTSDDLDSDGLTTAAVTVGSGDTNNTFDQGFYNLAKIGNFVWNDLDADGVQDSNEPAIDGVAVSLMQGLTQVTSAITINGGQYTLNAAPGTYTVKFTKPRVIAKSALATRRATTWIAMG